LLCRVPLPDVFHSVCAFSHHYRACIAAAHIEQHFHEFLRRGALGFARFIRRLRFLQRLIDAPLQRLACAIFDFQQQRRNRFVDAAMRAQAPRGGDPEAARESS